MNPTLVKVVGRIALVVSVVASIGFMAAAPRLPMGAAIFLGCFFGFAGTIFATAIVLYLYSRVLMIAKGVELTAKGVELTAGVIASQSQKRPTARQAIPPRTQLVTQRRAFDPRDGSIPHNDPPSRHA